MFDLTSGYPEIAGGESSLMGMNYIFYWEMFVFSSLVILLIQFWETV